MIFLRQLYILIKRILHKPVMDIIILIIPAIICIVNFLPEYQQSTEIKSGIYIESPDSYTNQLSSILQNDSTGFTFRSFDGEQELKDAVASNEIDSGYVFPSGLSNGIISGSSDGMITVYTSPSSAFMEVSSEAVYAALLKIYAPDMTTHMLKGTYFPEGADISAPDTKEYISSHYSKYIDNNSIFSINTSLSGEFESTDSIQPRNFPVDILVYITIFICSLMGLQCYMKDMEDGVYAALSKTGRLSFCTKNIAAGIIPAAIIDIISLTIYMGSNITVYDLAGVLIVSAISFVICILLKYVFRNYKIITISMPFIIICMLLLSLLSSLSQR